MPDLLCAKIMIRMRVARRRSDGSPIVTNWPTPHTADGKKGFTKFLESGKRCLVKTPEDVEYARHVAASQTAQCERRKLRMKKHHMGSDVS